MLDNLQDDNSSNGKTDHVPHLLSPYYNSGQQCNSTEEVQQHQQQHHQEQQFEVHEILLRNWKFENCTEKVSLNFASDVNYKCQKLSILENF